MLGKEYIAGYFDGEGHIRIGTRGWLTCRVRAPYKPVLEELQTQFGGSLYSEPQANPHRKQLWTWSINNNDAERFLREIEPLLSEKGDQARIALAYQSKRNRSHGHLTDANQALLTFFRQELTNAKRQEFAS